MDLALPDQRAEIIFEFKRNGRECGFLSCHDRNFVFKPDKFSAAVIPVEILKKNLRLMIKSKRARLIRAGGTEAVAVPQTRFLQLFE